MLMMFIFQYFIFNLQELSKYLLAKGCDEEILAVCVFNPLCNMKYLILLSFSVHLGIAIYS
jgi:hypothetical protein